MNSPYELFMRKNENCKLLCNRTYGSGDVKKFRQFIKDEYRINWIVDNLPSVTKHVLMQSNENAKTVYEKGFPVGFVGDKLLYPDTETGVSYLYNHVRILIKYHDDPDNYEGSRIVGFEVIPFSIAHQKVESETGTSFKCNVNQPLAIHDGEEVAWTYDVVWEASDLKWASRWDPYLLMADTQIHWFSIINSLMIVFFLTGMVAMIMLRTLHADLRHYNELDSLEEGQEETGWKLVHGDVFRRPQYPMVLSVFFGTGVQLLVLAVTTLGFAVLGFLSPANRGGLMTVLVAFFVTLGSLAGYFSAQQYKFFRGTDWKKCTLFTALGLPSFVFTLCFILDLFLWGKGSSGAIPFSTMFALLCMWFGVSVPMVFLGAYYGFKREAYKPPVRTNQIPRQIPALLWYMRPVFVVLMGGVLPFGAIFIELFFILSSIWLNQFYYLFGFLFVVFLILVVTCAEISIVMCYFQLCCEDYHWWWRSFLTSGASAGYMFLYSVIYYSSKLEISDFISGLVFFTYTTIMCTAFFLLTGCIGFYACFQFVSKIYASVKVD
eukprot:GCRY01001051.1.p1 GENE.GCRY01001051.1~~GCRY01001051.1.p1  ORF type:complete len:548 (+),score=105.79 GCRY01001051.1:399-2042(+)